MTITLGHKLLDVVAKFQGESLVHRDLKPANIMLHQADDGSFTVKLIDFGSSGMESGEPMPIEFGTPQYLAPELEAKDGKVAFTDKSDIYALGKSLENLFEVYHQGSMRIPLVRLNRGDKPVNIDTERLKNFIAKLTDVNPVGRLSAADALVEYREMVDTMGFQLPEPDPKGSERKPNP